MMDYFGTFRIDIPVVLTAGVVVGGLLFLAHVLFITTRYRIRENAVAATQELRESVRSYRDQFARNTSVMLLIDQEDGTIVDANDAALTFYGYTRERLLSMSITEINTLPVADVRQAMVTVPQGKGKRFHFIHRLADGSLRNVDVSASTIKFGGRTVLHSIVYDNTEQKSIEQALRDSEEKHRRMFETMSQGVIYFTTGGTIISANPAAERILGFTLGQLLGKHFSNPDWQLVREDGSPLPYTEDPIIIVMRTGKPVNRSIIGMMNPHIGVRQWLAITGVPIFRDGEDTLLQIFSTFEDITERKQAEQAIEASRDELRTLAARLVQVREEERTAIAREFHDELGQNLTALNMNVAGLSIKLKHDTALQEKLERMQQSINAMIREVRRIATDLRPAVLDELGLAEAVQWHAQKYMQESGVESIVQIDPAVRALPREIATAMFRIFQESLTNVVRHSGATTVTIVLAIVHHALRMTVTDNGRGALESELHHARSIGILGMRERASALGGEVVISGIAGSGTSVITTIPLEVK